MHEQDEVQVPTSLKERIECGMTDSSDWAAVVAVLFAAASGGAVIGGTIISILLR